MICAWTSSLVWSVVLRLPRGGFCVAPFRSCCTLGFSLAVGSKAMGEVRQAVLELAGPVHKPRVPTYSGTMDGFQTVIVKGCVVLLWLEGAREASLPLRAVNGSRSTN